MSKSNIKLISRCQECGEPRTVQIIYGRKICSDCLIDMKKKPCCRNCAYSEPSIFDDEVDCIIYSVNILKPDTELCEDFDFKEVQDK